MVHGQQRLLLRQHPHHIPNGTQSSFIFTQVKPSSLLQIDLHTTRVISILLIENLIVLFFMASSFSLIPFLTYKSCASDVIFISLLSVHHKNSETFFQSLFLLLLIVILPRISFIFVHSCSYLPSIHWWIVNVESSYTTTCSLRATTIGMPSFVVTILDDVAPQILFNSWGVTTITVATTWFKQTQIVWEQWKIECFEKHKW